MVHYISDEKLTIEKISSLLKEETKIELSSSAKEKIEKCRNYLDQKMKDSVDPVYGINTGFGSLCNTEISKKDLGILQRNLVMSHACGVGERVPSEIVKLMMLLKIQGLSYGHSGVQLKTVERLVYFYNNNLIPLVYQQGSLGASGDLSPLAHMSLPILGLGEMEVDGKIVDTEEVYKAHDLTPIDLQSKEGLALLNGTQFMSAYGVHILIKMNTYNELADLIAAASIDAYDGRLNPFNDNVNLVRSQPGQIKTARNIRRFLEGSELIVRSKKHVQDPYSFRCVPQVHGASKDMIDHCVNIFTNEINSVTDNPTIFPDEDEIVSAGNFHGQPLAITFDALSLAIAELASISERRVYKLIGGERGLPAYLVAKPGLNSGFMIPQYTAASIVSQNKQLATPCVVDTIDSSNGQEDHVSMGANGATKTYRILENLEKVLGIELLNALQALDLRSPAKSSPSVESLKSAFRSKVPYVEDDTIMYKLMHKSIDFIKTYSSC